VTNFLNLGGPPVCVTGEVRHVKFDTQKRALVRFVHSYCWCCPNCLRDTVIGDSRGDVARLTARFENLYESGLRPKVEELTVFRVYASVERRMCDLVVIDKLTNTLFSSECDVWFTPG